MYKDFKKNAEEREAGKEIASLWIFIVSASLAMIQQLRADVEKLKTQLKKRADKQTENDNVKYQKQLSNLELQSMNMLSVGLRVQFRSLREQTKRWRKILNK